MEDLLLRSAADDWPEVAERLQPLCHGGDLLIDDVREPGIWMLIGAPGAGKTTFSRAAASAGRHAVLLGEIRSAGGWKFREPEFLTEAYRIALAEVERFAGRGVVLDSTGLYPPARERLAELAAAAELPLRAVVLATEPELAWRRSLEKEWPEPLLFFRFLSSLCIQLDEIVGDTALASRHWLDGKAQERVIGAGRRVAERRRGGGSTRRPGGDSRAPPLAPGHH
jgi:predicted kinase